MFRLVREREGRVAVNKTDEELQFNLQLLAEVLSVRNAQLYRYLATYGTVPTFVFNSYLND